MNYTTQSPAMDAARPAIERIFRPDIAGMRALAVLAVLFYHAEITLFKGGFVGVDIFFVISGYLITRNILDDLSAEKFSLKRFYFARLKRLFPAFIFCLLLTFAMGVVLLAPVHLADLGKTTINAILSLSNIFFWKDAGYFATDSRYLPLLHTWSLSVEEQFYMFWPILLLLCFRTGKPWVLIATISVIFALSLWGAVWVSDKDASAGFYLVPFRMFEFCIGAGCIWFERLRDYRPLERELFMVIGLALTLYACFQFDAATPFPSYTALIPCLGSALLILGGPARFTGLLFRNPLAVGIGNISYSLYLMHWPLLVFGRYLKFGDLTASETVAAIALAFALSIFSYFVIENPLRALQVGKRVLKPTSYIIGCLTFALLTTYLSAHAWGSKGWKFRIDREARLLMWFTNIDTHTPCRATQGELKSSRFRCIFGADSRDGEVDVALIGDSHADQWIPGLDKLFREAGISAAYSGGGGSMPFIIGQSMNKDGMHFSYTETYKYILRKKPRLVIMAGRWAVQAHVYAPEGHTVWFGLNGYRRETPESSQAAMQTAAKATFDELEKIGTNVVVLGQMPYIAIDLIACMTRPQMLGPLLQNTDCHGYTAEQALKRDAVMGDFFESTAQKYENVHYLGLSKKLCTNREYCLQETEGTVLYRDDDHISYRGAILLSDRYFRTKILELLKTGS